jgi:hypothetical protein
MKVLTVFANPSLNVPVQAWLSGTGLPTGQGFCTIILIGEYENG